MINKLYSFFTFNRGNSRKFKKSMPLNLEYGYFGADLCICIGNLNFFGRLTCLMLKSGKAENLLGVITQCEILGFVNRIK
jgi:hypothetical protein